MNWYESITSPHLQYWSRLARQQYVNQVRHWCALRSKVFDVTSQVAAYDRGRGKSKYPLWYELVLAAKNANFNPLQVVKYEFDYALTHSYREYPRPTELFKYRVKPEEMNEVYQTMTTASIKADLVKLSRLKDQAKIILGLSLNESQLNIFHQSVAEAELSNSVIVAGVIAQVGAPLPSRVQIDFLLSPEPYLCLASHLIPRQLFSLKTINGNSFHGNVSKEKGAESR